MTEEQTGQWGYKVGPGAAMLQEIGQIMVNHSYCEWGIKQLFIALLKAPADHAKALIDSQNMKAITMTKTIDLIIKDNSLKLPSEFLTRISGCLASYRNLSARRNQVAHWNWLMEENGVAEAQNLMKGSASSVLYDLDQLRQISFGLIESSTAAILLSGLVSAIPMSMQDNVLTLVFEKYDGIMARVKEAVLSLPDLAPAAEDTP